MSVTPFDVRRTSYPHARQLAGGRLLLRLLLSPWAIPAPRGSVSRVAPRPWPAWPRLRRSGWLAAGRGISTWARRRDVRAGARRPCLSRPRAARGEKKLAQRRSSHLCSSPRLPRAREPRISVCGALMLFSAFPPSPPALVFSAQAVAFAVAAALPKLVGCGIGLARTLHSPRSATRPPLCLAFSV